MVGWAMHESPAGEEFPAHRVIASSGKLTAGWLFGHPEVMKQRLVEEGVPFKAQYQVDIRQCLWQPVLVGTTAYEMDDFDDIPWLEEGFGEALARDDGSVDLDDD
jgi:hypothetical protein